MKRGRKGTTNAIKIVRGTFQKERSRAAVVKPIAGPVAPPPAWLRGLGRRLWRIKVATYARRDQSVVGCEAALAQYCAVEADLARRWRMGADVPASLVNAFRILCAEFFDTPASQIGHGTTAAPANRFVGHATAGR